MTNKDDELFEDYLLIAHEPFKLIAQLPERVIEEEPNMSIKEEPFKLTTVDPSGLAVNKIKQRKSPQWQPSTTQPRGSEVVIPDPTPDGFQMAMFQELVINSAAAEMSNTIELWDSIPKYRVTPEQTRKLRTADGLAKPFNWSYTYRDRDSLKCRGATHECTLRIHPALISTEDNSGGQVLAYFPGQTEEFVEEILRKFLLDQQFSAHNVSQEQTWVRFSLRMIERELKAIGKSRSSAEIKQSLQIMRLSQLELERNGRKVYSGGIILELIEVTQNDIRDDGGAMWAAKLSSLVSAGINRLQYRQLNYTRLTLLESSLARWIYRRLVNRFTQASSDRPFTIGFCELQQSTGLLVEKTDRHNRHKLQLCLNDLAAHDVIAHWESVEVRDRRKIVNVIYTITASQTFIEEQIKANTRAKNARSVAANKGVVIDNP